jgi:hypothetical protein
MLVLVLGE